MKAQAAVWAEYQELEMARVRLARRHDPGGSAAAAACDDGDVEMEVEEMEMEEDPSRVDSVPPKAPPAEVLPPTSMSTDTAWELPAGPPTVFGPGPMDVDAAAAAAGPAPPASADAAAPPVGGAAAAAGSSESSTPPATERPHSTPATPLQSAAAGRVIQFEIPDDLAYSEEFCMHLVQAALAQFWRETGQVEDN